MKHIIFCFLLFPLILFSEEFIIVKQIWGQVNLIESNIKSELKSYHKIQKNQLIKLENDDSKVWVRDQDNNHLRLQFSKNNNVFSYSDILSKINESNKTVSIGETSFKKFFSLISMPNSNSSLGAKVNGMFISPPTGTSRSTNEFIKLNYISAFEDFPVEINFSHIFDTTNSNSIYDFKLYDRIGRTLKLEQSSQLPSLILKFDTIKGSIETIFKLEVSCSSSQQKILANIKLININSNDKKVFDELKDLALLELENNESFYQIILIEALLSRNLKVSANYFLNLFNRNSDNIEIQELHKKYNSN